MLKVLAAFFGLLLLAGCSSSHTFVLDPPTGPRTHNVVAVKQIPSWMPIPADVSTAFEKKIAGKLPPEAKPAGDTTPPDLVIQYRFVLFDTGSSAARIGSGVASLAGSPFYGVGDGTLGVDVIFTDPAGTALARIVVDGPVSGVFGTTDAGLNKASLAIVNYTKMFFIPEPPKPNQPTRQATSTPSTTPQPSN